MNATLKMNSAATAAQSVQLVLGSLLERSAQLIRRVRQAVRTENEIQEALTELSAMSEHQLRDIGLSRADIEPAVRGLRR